MCVHALDRVASNAIPADERRREWDHVVANWVADDAWHGRMQPERLAHDGIEER